MIYSAISIRQPYAALIALGIKDIENRRNWRFPNRRGLTLVHAPKAVEATFEEVRSWFTEIEWAPAWWLKRWDEAGKYLPHVFQAGGIVGAVEIVGLGHNHPSPWADRSPDTDNLMLRNGRVLPFHPCPGRLGIFKVDYPYEIAPVTEHDLN